MANVCCVPNCTTDTNLSSENINLYKVPANKEIRYLWNKAIGQKTKCTDYVCSKHFMKDEFIKYMKPGKDKNKNYKIELSDKAIPSIFPTSYIQTTVQPALDEETYNLQGTLLPKVEPMSSNYDKSLLTPLETDQNNYESQNSSNVHELLPSLEKDNNEDSHFVEEETSADESESSENQMDDDYSDLEGEADDFEAKIEQNIVKKPLVDAILFQSLWDGGESVILLPGPNWGLHCLLQSEKLIVISEMEMINGLPKVFHQITVSARLNLSYFIRTKRIEENVVEEFHLNSSVSCMSDLENSLTAFIAVNMCEGGPSEMEFTKSQIATHLATVDEQTHRWVHRNCLLLTRNDEEWCKSCATLEEYFCKVTLRPFIYQ